MAWLTPDLEILLATACAIGVLHTLAGPDHYLPFISVGRERSWSLKRTLGITALCGAGHCAGSIAIGIAGIAAGIGIGSIEALEGFRGNAAAWALTGFGIAYLLWSLRGMRRRKRHRHVHVHADGTVHDHDHDHSADHAHAHTTTSRPIVLALVVVFVLGPCEALIPMLMYPAATANVAGVVAVTLVFSLTTIATMLIAVAAGASGLRRTGWQLPPGVAGAMTGTVIAGCGAAMLLGF